MTSVAHCCRETLNSVTAMEKDMDVIIFFGNDKHRLRRNDKVPPAQRLLLLLLFDDCTTDCLRSST